MTGMSRAHGVAVAVLAAALIVAGTAAAQQDSESQIFTPGQDEDQGQGQLQTQPEAQAPTQGQTQGGQQDLITTRNGDWTVRCNKPQGDPNRRCDMVQAVTHSESGRRALEVMVATGRQNNQPVAIFLLPLGVSLPQGIQVSVDDGKTYEASYQRCVKAGCIAQLPLNGELLAAMKAGRRAQVSLVAGNGREVQLPVSLMGFTESYADVQ